MATQANLIGRPSNEFIDDLVWGGAWTGGAVSYSFASAGYLYSPVLGQYVYNAQWLQSEKTAIKAALNTIDDVANINFTYTSNASSANLLYVNVSEATLGSGTLGISDVPGVYSSSSTLQTIFNYQDSSWLHLQKGGYGFSTIVHEILHSVGLAHPHDTGGFSGIFPGVGSAWDSGNYQLNQQIYTIMSYVDGSYTPGYSGALNYGYAAGPMAFDIAALQYIYGANMSTATGATSYTLPTSNTTGTYWECIWDAGGNDTIRTGSTQRDAVIDLRQATLLLGDAHAGGFISHVKGIQGGFTIAYGATIENAIGSHGDDTLRGNYANNKLAGQDGDDKLFGFGNNDRLLGADGNDTLYGGDGNDRLIGGNGSDVLIGGSGSDTAIFGGNGDATINLNVGSRQHTGQGSDIIRGVENLMTGNGDDRLIGSGANNLLNGRGGDDVLTGNGGDDRLVGGGGEDRLIGSQGQDTLNGGAAADNLIAGVGDDLVLGGAGGDTLSGGPGSDKLVAGSGHDRILGGAGNDQIFGGGGRDTLIGSIGDDRMAGGAHNDTFVFTRGFGDDNIADFTPGHDMVDLSNYGGASNYADIDKSYDSDGNAVAELGTNSITFIGLRWSDLSSHDFIF